MTSSLEMCETCKWLDGIACSHPDLATMPYEKGCSYWEGIESPGKLTAEEIKPLRSVSVWAEAKGEGMSSHGRFIKSIIRRMRAGKLSVIVFPLRCENVYFCLFRGRPLLLAVTHRDLLEKRKRPTVKHSLTVQLPSNPRQMNQYPRNPRILQWLS